MTSDLEMIFASKAALRRRLASLPIAEKLQMLDELRERELVIRGRPSRSAPGATAQATVVRADKRPRR